MADDPNYPVGTAAVNWVDSGGQVHLRVYSCDGYTITERCYDGSWTTGFTCPGSDVSATAWQDSGGVHIRLYATLDDKTTEWCYDNSGSWYVGAYTQP